MNDFYDDLETRAPELREAALFDALRRQVANAQERSPHYRETLGAVDPASLADRSALAALPVLTKSDLIAMQEAEPPFGGLSAARAGRFKRLFLSPGPISEPERESGPGGDQWRMARALNAAGFREHDVAINCFSYHLTPAGFMFDHAAAEIGCALFPGGTGNTETQVQAIRRFAICGYIGTPDFLKIIMEKADELGTPVTTISHGLVTAGPLFPQLRDWYADRNVEIRQCYGTAELGLIAYEAAGPGDGMVMDEHCIVEIVRPGTGDPVPDGEAGEVVVTTFNEAYPLIRLATGDLSAVMEGQSPCGRTNKRLKGWMGRADQTAKVRGMFVHPSQIARTIGHFREIEKARAEISLEGGKDRFVLKVECRAPGEGLAAAVENAIRAECRLRGEAEIVAPGTLPNDGKVIDDRRDMGG